jgi:hypothetical protein
MKKLCIALAASLVALAGCGTDSVNNENGATVLQSGTHSALKDQIQEQYHDSAALQAAWTKIYVGQGSAPALPNIDFGTSTVILYATGEMKHGGFTIRIDHAEATATGYEVGITVNQPGTNCPRTTTELTHPFIVAILPTTAQVTFDQVKTHEAPPCT